MASRQSREYRTLQRNFSIVVESLAPNVDPTHFAQKLNEVNLVTKNVVDCASVMSIPPAQRIQPVVAAVHAQIKLRASLYHKFIDVVQQFNPLLAEVLGKFYDMLGVMSGITDLKPLGHELDLDPVKLNELQQGGGGPEQHAEELLVLWQQKDGDPSWEKLARALKRMGEHEMARRIGAKHVHNPHSDDSGVCGSTPLCVDEARKEQDRLQGKFEALIHSTWDVLKQEQVDVSQLCHTISILPIMIKGEHKKFLLDNLPQLCNARNIDEALCLLNLYMDYLNYSLLEHIITKHGNTVLQQKMVEYVADLQSFRRRTPLHVFCKIQPWRYTEIPPYFKSLVLKQGKATPTSTLEDIEYFRQQFARQYSLSDITLMVASITPGSVVITWLIPSSIVDEVKKEITNGNAEFFRENEVTQVTVDGTTLYEVPQPASVIDDLKVSVMKIEGKGHTIDIESKVWMHRMMRMKDSDELSVDSGFGGSVVSSRRSSFSEGVPSDAPTRDDEEALKFAADLTANRTAPSREFVRATISDRAAAALSDGLSNNRSLRELELRECKISSVGVAALATALSYNTFLKTLRLQNCRITDDSMVELSQALLQNETLEELDLGNPPFGVNNNKITHLGASSLSKALLSNKSLKTLDLRRNELADQGICSIAEALHGNETLQSLGLGNNNISDQGATALAKLLKTNRAIKTLGLKGNRIADQGVCSIADALHGNETLQSLDLSGNKISDQGATALAKSLETNRAIKTLDLSVNKIADQGVCAIADALHGNVTLKSLDLSLNNITDVGILALSAMLPLNKSLQHLEISLSYVTDEGVIQLASGLEGSTSLKTLKLRSTRNISRETMKILRDSAQRRGIKLKILP